MPPRLRFDLLPRQAKARSFFGVPRVCLLSGKQPEPRLYNGFRKLLADKSIDAVDIATLDHGHVPIGLAAVRPGKDFCIEKPLGHSQAQK